MDPAIKSLVSIDIVSENIFIPNSVSFNFIWYIRHLKLLMSDEFNDFAIFYFPV